MYVFSGNVIAMMSKRLLHLVVWQSHKVTATPVSVHNPALALTLIVNQTLVLRLWLSNNFRRRYL